MGQPRIPVSLIAGVGIIYRESNPREIFLERKGVTYPTQVFRRKLSLIGGNWRGDAAHGDHSPLDTFLREVDEEIRFDRPVQDTGEMLEATRGVVHEFKSTPCLREPSKKEWLALEDIRASIATHTKPWRDYLISVSVDSGAASQPYSGLCSCFTVPLGEAVWGSLSVLQSELGNLSSESESVIISLDEILESQRRIEPIGFAFGHDRLIRQFWLDQGIEEALALFLFPSITVVPQHYAFDSYAEYLLRYDVGE